VRRGDFGRDTKTVSTGDCDETLELIFKESDMTEDEAVKKIIDPLMHKTLEYFSKTNDIEFEKTFEDIVEQKQRGVRVYYPMSIYPEVMIAFHVASSYTLTTLDGDNSRYNVLAKGLGAAMAGISARDNKSDIKDCIRQYNEKSGLYVEYLNGVRSVSSPHFLSIIDRAGLPIPSDSKEQDALSYRLWSMVCLERILLGKYYKPERQGDLCFRFADMAKEFADNMRRVADEYCGPVVTKTVNTSVSNNKSGCLVPFVVMFSAIVGGVAAVLKLVIA